MKLKSVFSSSSKKKAPSDEGGQSAATSPRSAHVDRRATSLDEQRRRQSAEVHRGGAQHTGRSRPLSSVYDSGRPHNDGSGPVAFDYAQPHAPRLVDDSIANDYKAYQPVLTPVDDSNDAQHMTLGGDRRLISGESDGRHEEDVADRNIGQHRTSLDVSRRKPLPATPGMCIDQSTVLHEAETAILVKNHVNGFAVLNTTDQDFARKQSAGANTFGSTIRTVPSASTGKYSLGGDVSTKGGLKDSMRPHTEANAHEKHNEKKSDRPSRSAQEESQLGWGRRQPRASESDDEAPRAPPANLKSREIMPSADGQYQIEKEIHHLLEGVVDLKDTVEEHKNVQWAPGK